MIDERQLTHGFLPLESLPPVIQCRLRNALSLLAESSCYAASRTAEEFSPVAYRFLDLFHTGVTSLDCRWLLAGEYIVPLPCGSGRRSTSADPWLDEQTFVALTETGRALLALLEKSVPATSPGRADLRFGRHDATPTIHYDRESRALFVAEMQVLRLPARAVSMGAVLERFEDLAWRPHGIPSPFGNLGHHKRSQAARDATHALKQRQHPLVIDFHTSQKGATIWYELLHENLPRDAAMRRAVQLPR